MGTTTNRVVKLYLILAAVGGFALAMPLLAGVGPCILYYAVGIPCPACGMTRAFISLPDVGQALVYHPLFFTVPFIPLLGFLPERRMNIGAVVLIVLFLGVWVVRMVLFFPHTQPMVLNENSLVHVILARLGG